MNFRYYYFRMFTKPGKTFEKLTSVAGKVRFGAMAALIPAVGYTIFYIMAWQAGGAPSEFKPWLAIPAEDYFFWDIFLSIPGVFISIITAAGIIHLVSKPLGGQGTFEDTFVVISFGAGVATWGTMLHDLTDSFLSFIGVIDMKKYEILLNEQTFWHYMLYTLFLIYFVWFILLFTKGLKVVQKLSTGKALVLGVFSLIIYQGILLIFIR